MKQENLDCLDIFKTLPGPVAKNATLGHPTGNATLGHPAGPKLHFSQQVPVGS